MITLVLLMVTTAGATSQSITGFATMEACNAAAKSAEHIEIDKVFNSKPIKKAFCISTQTGELK
jgi:hypothetical protein